MTITPLSTTATKGRMQVIFRTKHIGEQRFKAQQAKYNNVLKLVRNESGYQTSATYNDFVKNGVVQMVKKIRETGHGFTDVTPFEFTHDSAYAHIKGDFRTNIQQRLEEHNLIENIIPTHATWLVQA